MSRGDLEKKRKISSKMKMKMKLPRQPPKIHHRPFSRPCCINDDRRSATWTVYGMVLTFFSGSLVTTVRTGTSLLPA